MKTISLVLGSGGARGLAHIGVIRWLEQQGYEIRSISGCSVGALVGGIYAAGKLDEFEQWTRTIRRKDILSMLDIAWSRSGLVKGERMVNTLSGYIGDHSIEDLPIAFTAVAVDLNKGKEIWLNKGDLLSAIRASSSIPLLFTPTERAGTLVVDGGVLNPVPITPTFGDDTDMTIAVNLDADIPFTPQKVPQIRSIEQKEELEKTSQFRKRLAAFNTKVFDSIFRENGNKDSFFSVAMQSFETMQSTIARHKIAAYPPDHLIEISRHASKTLELDRADELIQLGYDSAAKQLSKLKQKPKL